MKSWRPRVSALRAHLRPPSHTASMSVPLPVWLAMRCESLSQVLERRFNSALETFAPRTLILRLLILRLLIPRLLIP